MTTIADGRVSPRDAAPSPWSVVPVLGITQILAWGTSYYLLAVLAQPIAEETGWPLAWVVGGLSLGLLVAGFVSPRVGAGIQRLGGRPVLAGSAVLFALGFVGLALSSNLAVYLVCWLILGVAMGAGLYDAAFSTLGRIYGLNARTAIAALTLFGGFASTVCWPLSAFLVAELGWRAACMVYAGVHLLVLLPFYVFLLPKEARHGPVKGTAAEQIVSPHASAEAGRPGGLFSMVALVITIGSVISATLSVHLIALLQARDIALGAAVALGALVGPAQVGARAIQMAFSRRHHPVWTKLVATACVATGTGLLWAGFPVISAALVFYGAGIGIESIVRGTLPLAVFGARDYPAIMGRIAMPSLIGQAAAPSAGALLIEVFGAEATLGAIFGLAIVNVGLVAVLSAMIMATHEKRREKRV